MVEADVIIVGGGPAGAACARELRNQGYAVVILDRYTFPRHKVCAGWITPRVLSDLDTTATDYPGGILTIRCMILHIRGITFPLPTRQFSIRRFEFDHWLIRRAGVPVYEHRVRYIRKDNRGYIVDDAFRAPYLVGAAGTFCPVYRTFFESCCPRTSTGLVVTLEDEFEYAPGDTRCRLWFFDRHLPGYAWYVPKTNGIVNIGIGAKFHTLHARGATIHDHWQHFITHLAHLALIKDHAWQPVGHAYYLRQPRPCGRVDNAFVIGDAAGLATTDFGEGIGPAVRSGVMAAKAIAQCTPYLPHTIGRYSLFNIVFPWRTGRWKHITGKS